VKHLNRGKQVLHEKPIVMEAMRDGVEMDIALQYNDSYSDTVFSFANNINTVDGGSHLSGFRTSLTRTINAVGQALGLFKDMKENLSGDDVREGPGGRDQRQAVAAAVRGPDQGQAELRHCWNGAGFCE
jgi:DNA gyrase subunit B